MGDIPIFGHGCRTLEEKEAYIKALNDNTNEEDSEYTLEKRNERISQLSEKSKKEIRDLLGDI